MPGSGRRSAIPRFARPLFRNLARWARQCAEGLGLGSSRSGSEDLWDRWLDADVVVAAEPAAAIVAVDPAPSFVPRRAYVRPRVIAPESGEAFCLEDEVLSFAKTGGRGAVRITGPAGVGKTTALEHLAAVLPRALGVRVCDEPEATGLGEQAESGLVVYVAEVPIAARHLVTYSLAPWGDDEWIEYLLATARPQCGSVMSRLKTAADREWLGGNAELWRIVLDRMAGDANVATPRGAALSQELATRLADDGTRRLAEELCLARLVDVPAIEPATEPFGRLEGRCRDRVMMRLVRHRPVQLLMAAPRLVTELAADGPCEFLGIPLSRDLIQETGALLQENAAGCAGLRLRLLGPRRSEHPMAASLLHASRTGWRPESTHPPRLSGAYLEGAGWNAVDLSMTELVAADLTGADLAQGRLDGANADRARFRGACLRGASLEGTTVRGADLGQADLGSVRARFVQLQGANLEGANLTGARLQDANLQGARLTGARLVGADLTRADLSEAGLDGADLTGATLDEAKLKGLTLSHAEFQNARFTRADLTGCDLEDMELPRACFRHARLHSALLTGSRMPAADFRGACLRNAGLAEIHWEGACLAGADLRLASFHLGSTRSGLVQSPIACEGSRTGFYTDDFDEQSFKPPEEIRKANLRGADLRGALIDDVDFYLVDLRGALFDGHQAEHFRRCGAILGQ